MKSTRIQQHSLAILALPYGQAAPSQGGIAPVAKHGLSSIEKEEAGVTDLTI
jgi:hypothetical protein